MSHKITSLSVHGDGIADGPIYAPFTLPGERIDGSIADNRIDAPVILTPSGDRVKAPCSHFRRCGGCAMQHASDGFLARWKANVVRQALVAHDISTDIRETLTSPPMSRRRAAFSGRRTKNGAIVGFHLRASTTVIPIPNCVLLTPGLLAIIPYLEQMTILGASRKAELTLVVTETENGPDVVVEGAKTADITLLGQLAELVEAARISRLTWNGEIVAQRAPPLIILGGVQVQLPAGAFLQATEHGQSMLIEQVRKIVGTANPVLDLFAGCGTFSLPLAQTTSVHAVEGDGEMMKTLDRAQRNATGLKPLTTETRDLFRNPVLPEELERFAAVIIDPPRAGAEAQTEMLANSRVETIASVSCNPITFARDAKRLVEGGYHLDWVQPVDQFRWSAHVELVAQFKRV